MSSLSTLPNDPLVMLQQIEFASSIVRNMSSKKPEIANKLREQFEKHYNIKLPLKLIQAPITTSATQLSELEKAFAEQQLDTDAVLTPKDD